MMGAVHPQNASWAPVIVRVAGLPASVLEPFGSARCAEALQALRELRDALAAARSALADRLHAAIPGADAALRRALLAARRDCFNGRPLSPYREKPEWPALRESGGELAGRVVDLEERLAAARAEVEAEHERQREREREHLLTLLADRGLLRGIALASPGTVESLPRLLAVPSSRYGRKETRLEETFLRYVTRAAWKLSPYSTLTRVGLGVLRDDLSQKTASLRGEEWEERSLLRLKRYVLDQLWDLLRSHPPFRDGLRVVLNDTIQSEAGRYRFLRPGAWEPQGDQLRFQPAALVKATLDGPVARWLLRGLPHRQPIYGELRRLLEAEIDPTAVPRGIQATLDRLVQAGFVCLLPPWPAHASHLEADLLRYLESLPDPDLAPVAGLLRRLIDLQTGFPTAPAPARSVREMERLTEDLWLAAAPLAGMAPGARWHRASAGNLYEDVFLGGASPGQEVFQLPGRAARGIQRSLAPVVRFLGLYDHRHDFLLTLGAFMAERWPGRGEVGALELFGETQPLWQSYMRFFRERRRAVGQIETFNPLGLAALMGMQRLREEVWERAAGCLEPFAGDLRLRGDELAAVVARIPESFTAGVGGCFFLQPADRSCRRWVMNRLYEGTGRYGSRFTAVMDARTRRAYTDHLTARSWDEHGDELLDITCPLGDTLNVHAAQTWRQLELPGQWLGLPPARRVSLGSLSVRRRDGGLPPELVDGRGRRCRPVPLGGADSEYAPTPLKILALFGPGEMRFTFPSREERVSEGVVVRPRLTLDNLVLRRRRWRVALPLLQKLAGTGTAEGFAALNLWRLEQGLPERAFLLERVYHERRDDLYKPQYLDFTSPLMVAVFRASLRHNREFLTFEEMLPTPDQALRDESGRSWAVEILLDELATRSPGSGNDKVHRLAASLAASHSHAEPSRLTDMEETHA